MALVEKLKHVSLYKEAVKVAFSQWYRIRPSLQLHH